jgi:hypothetical protein
MIPAAEAAVQRAVTRAFVDADAESVVLNARVKVSNGAGGYRWEESPRPAQVCRLNPLSEGAERMSSDGRLVQSTHTLVGYYGTVMDRFDRFTLGGRTYEITYVYENREYQTKAEVIHVG